jgi:hypothetical protein
MSKAKSMRKFIMENRRQIDAIILSQPAMKQRSSDVELTDAERRKWVLNHGGLSRWAQREGVKG